MAIITPGTEHVYPLARLVRPNTAAGARSVSAHAVRAAAIAAMRATTLAHGADLLAANAARRMGISFIDYFADLRNRPDHADMVMQAMWGDLGASTREAERELRLGGVAENISPKEFGVYAGRLLVVTPPGLVFPEISS